MGGRMSGESPREEKVVVWNCRTDVARRCQTKAADDVVMATAVGQASRQQFAMCDPLGQHDECAAPALLSVAVWQSDCPEVLAAKAAKDPCRPMASIKIRATS
jgi:hypothetical protein